MSAPDVAVSTTTTPVHLLVLVHGMWGNPAHLAELARIIREEADAKSALLNSDPSVASDEANPTAAPPPLRVLVAETNRDEGTYDGIDWGGERLTDEILEEVRKLEQKGEKVTRFSITGYSLGGLLARYIVGVLHQRHFFQDVAPVNFNTFATPHLGLLRYSTLLSTLFSHLGPKLLSRTGEQFYCVDKWSNTSRPLLQVMADPDFVFWQALSHFQHIRIYANAVNDLTVPYITASISTSDPFFEHRKSGIKIAFNEKYHPLIASYSLPSNPLPSLPGPTVLSPQWFRSLTPERPLLPPALQFPFPLNIVLYASLPLLVPSVLSLVLIRLSLAARSSRARIKRLERDEASAHKLVNLIVAARELEAEAEDAVVAAAAGLVGAGGAEAVRELEMEIDDESCASSEASISSSSPMSASVASLASTSPSSEAPEGATPAELQESEACTPKAASGEAPEARTTSALRPVQHWIAERLNALPGLQKEVAYIGMVRNSHAVIVCRDVKRFQNHREGEGVLRHWASVFVL